MANKIDSRQITYKGTIDQLSTTTTTEADNLFNALGSESTPLLRLSAASSPSLVVSVGPALITNPETNRSRSIPHIGVLLPNNFTSGTVTFPASSGGTITVSPGNNGTLTVASGNFIKVLIYMDSTGALNVLPGVEAALAVNATVIAAPAKTLPIGYVTLQNVGGVVQNIAQTAIVQFGTGAGGGGAGTGSGLGDDLGSLQYKASFSDDFSDIPTSALSSVDVTAGKTDANTYSAANGYFRIAYDATKTVTGTGTAMTMSGAPTFTVKIGDVLRVGTQVRRITAVGSQTLYTIESAFTVNPSASAATVSQAVYTKDINNFVGDGQAISTAFSTTINQILVNYEDTTTASDVIFDANTTPVIAYSASADGSTYSPVSVRATNLVDQAPSLNLPVVGTTLFLRFFANNTSGSGLVNILGYKTFLHKDAVFQDGSVLNQSSCYTNNSGTAINTALVAVVSGKTRIQKTWSYPMGVNSGTNNGSLTVYLNGQKIPRYISATATPDASYKEIDQRTIELDQDYSGIAMFVEIIQDVAVVDASDTNVTNISQSQEFAVEGFQGFVKTSQLINATSSVGSPTAGTFHSTILNRSSMPDLTQDLRARFGVNRVQTQIIYPIPNEFGPAGEQVMGLAGDIYNQFRAVGVWASGTNINGAFFSTVTVGDFVEITFYGTGLNIMANYGFAYDVRASVDGGAEGSNLFIATGSSILLNRNYVANQIIPAVSGLALGVHTVKIRNNNANGINFMGYEIINDTATVRVNPGTSFVGNKKLTLSAQSAFAHNTTFESGTLGTRGGRVLVYQKADGSIAKSVTPVDATQLNYNSANHQNEEIVRIYNFREFGANRADDFSTMVNASSTRAFTLDDDTTTLAGSTVGTVTGSTIRDAIGIYSAAGYWVFTFVGTGLDLQVVGEGGAGTDSITISVDGTAVATGITGANTAGKSFIQKIVSGLPYGTHTVRMVRNAATTTMPYEAYGFIVYQPKKPALPSGCVEIADYNALATYAASATVGVDAVSTGIIRKSSAREVAYIGTWGMGLAIGEPTATQVNTTTNGDYFEYTFFGTGIEIAGRSGSGTNTMQVRIDGALYTGAATAIGSGSSWTAGTSTYLVSATTGAKLQISGLTLGQHTIRLTKNNAGDGFNLSGLDIISPIHSAKSVVPYDIMNTLSLGSNSLADARKLSPIKDINLQTKNISTAVGIAINPTVSGVAVPLPDMNVTHFNTTGRIRISFGGNFSITTNTIGLYVYIDGVRVSPEFDVNNVINVNMNIPTFVYNVTPGFHRVEIYWTTSAGTGTAVQNYRTLTVEEA